MIQIRIRIKKFLKLYDGTSLSETQLYTLTDQATGVCRMLVWLSYQQIWQGAKINYNFNLRIESTVTSGLLYIYDYNKAQLLMKTPCLTP